MNKKLPTPFLLPTEHSRPLFLLPLFSSRGYGFRATMQKSRSSGVAGVWEKPR
jgi:hypothetical protein